jgi:hypothetical protein
MLPAAGMFGTKAKAAAIMRDGSFKQCRRIIGHRIPQAMGGAAPQNRCGSIRLEDCPGPSRNPVKESD